MTNFFKSDELIWLVYILINYGFILLAFRLWGKVGLLIFIPISIIIANIQVVKLVNLFGMETTLGNIAYSSVFLVSDIMTENYGKKAANKVIGIGFFSLIFTTIVMNIAIMITPSVNDASHGNLAAIFGPFSRFTVASLIAYVCSSYSDIALYQLIRKLRSSYGDLWIRNNASTLISQILDNLIFSFIAFLGVYPLKIIISIVVSTYVLKIITSFFDTPFLYIATHWKNKGYIKEIV